MNPRVCAGVCGLRAAAPGTATRHERWRKGRVLVFRHASWTWAHSADYNSRKHDVRVNFMLNFDYHCITSGRGKEILTGLTGLKNLQFTDLIAQLLSISHRFSSVLSPPSSVLRLRLFRPPPSALRPPPSVLRPAIWTEPKKLFTLFEVKC